MCLNQNKAKQNGEKPTQKEMGAGTIQKKNYEEWHEDNQDWYETTKPGEMAGASFEISGPMTYAEAVGGRRKSEIPFTHKRGTKQGESMQMAGCTTTNREPILIETWEDAEEWQDPRGFEEYQEERDRWQTATRRRRSERESAISRKNNAKSKENRTAQEWINQLGEARK